MRKLERFGALFLAFALTLSLCTPAFAAEQAQVDAANTLYTLGLFSGTGTDAAGNPNFDLDRTPTRAEAVVMLVRLLGKEAEAKAGQWQTPFTDTAAYSWALPYIGYAYTNGLAQGNGTIFDGGSPTTATQYLTFVLRALGYDSKTDFQWDKAVEFASSLGLYFNANQAFTRGTVAHISFQALSLTKKGDTFTLLQQLVDSGAVTEATAASAGLQHLLRDPSAPATRAEFAHFLVSNFSIKDYGSPISLDNIDDVDSSTKYANDILLVMGTGILSGIGDNSFGPNRTITNAEVASVLVRFLLQSGCDLSAYTTAVNSPLITESAWYYTNMTYAVNLGIFSDQVDPAASTPYSALNDKLVESIMRLPDSNKIGAVSIYSEKIKLSYVEINEKLYQVAGEWNGVTLSRILLNGESSLYVPFDVSTNVTPEGTYTSYNSLFAFLLYCFGDYTIEPSDNPFIAGVISPKNAHQNKNSSYPLKVTVSETYTSITSKESVTTFQMGKLSLTTSDTPANYSSIDSIKGITYVNGYLRADELLNYFGIKKTVTIETRDDIQVLCIR